MEKKNLDWANIGFSYMPTDMRYVSNYKDGAWDEGTLTADSNVTINECAGILQYCQECFEGLKAYTTEDGSIVTFRPDMNAERMMDSASRLEMPVFPKEKFLDALDQVVKANAAWVPPYGSGATLYIRPYMFASGPVIGVKPAEEYQFRLFATPVGPYFHEGAKPITICVSDFDRAAPKGTGHIKAGLNYAMSLHANVTAHANGFDENLKYRRWRHSHEKHYSIFNGKAVQRFGRSRRTFFLIRDEGHGIVREAACGGCKKGCGRAHGSPLQRHGSYAV